MQSSYSLARSLSMSRTSLAGVTGDHENRETLESEVGCLGFGFSLLSSAVGDQRPESR